MTEKAYKLFFETLDNINRLRIINALRKKARNVSSISKECNLDQPIVSHNLARLKKCGFVFVERKGKERHYKLNQKTIKPLMQLIDKHMNAYCRKIVGHNANGKKRRGKSRK